MRSRVCGSAVHRASRTVRRWCSGALVIWAILGSMGDILGDLEGTWVREQTVMKLTRRAFSVESFQCGVVGIRGWLHRQP